MRPQIIWTIFRKELTEALRDRLTLFVVIGLPILLYPLMILGLSKIQASQEAAQEERVSRVGVWGEAPAALIAWLNATNHLSVTNWAGATAAIREGFATGSYLPPPDGTNDDGRERAQLGPNLPASRQQKELWDTARAAVLGGKLDAVVIAWPGFQRAVTDESLGRVAICYDSVRPGSEAARDRLRDALGAYRRHLVRERVQAHGLSEGFATGVEIRSLNLAPLKRQTGEKIGLLLPFVIILLSATGAMYASIDLTAGEKDRATMQTLLCAPVQNLEIVAGKFLTVWCISLLAALANAASIAATIARAAAGTSLSLLNLQPGTVLLAFALLLPATFTITSFFLAVAMLARDAKDAGNFLGASLTLLMMPMGAVLMPGVSLNAWTAFVPLVNLSLLTKALFLGEARADTLFLAVLSSLLYAALAIAFAARTFGREQILLGGRGTIGVLLRPENQSRATPTPSLALATFAGAMVLAYYGSLLLAHASVITAVLTTQGAFFLLPVAALVVLMKFSPRATLSLRRPPWRGVLAAILIGVSGWAAVGGLVLRLLPPPESLVKALEKIVLLENSQSPLWLLWLVMAITPACCEELLFRGLILSGLRRLGPWPALLISSLLFAVAHASIYRLLPTFCLGLLLGYIVLKTGSLFCSMIIHALNNGLAVTLARSHALTTRFGLEDATYVPWSMTLPALALVLVALWLLRPVRPPATAD
ncbi:MAG TPA: ABC transporter permease subunit/CPBP intramembrane protease [Verrucomicrobiae bacterium]|nr:ABC transporter permease subunit/CPBP intramembrane protease [Verrucomicrobiae bacterium]